MFSARLVPRAPNRGPIRRFLQASVVCVVFLLDLEGAAAQEAVEGAERVAANIWIDASSRSSCEEMEQLPGRARDVARAFPATEWRPDIYFAMERGEGQASGRVAVRFVGEELFRKELKAPSCHDVIEALLLSLQIYVEALKPEDLPSLDQTSRKESSQERGAPPGWPGPDLDPFALSPEEDPFARKKPKPPPIPNVRSTLFVGPVRGFNVLPNSTWGGTGAELSATISFNAFVGLDGGTRFLTSSPLFVDGIRYRFSSTSFYAGPSRSFRVSEITTLRLNLTGVVTLIHTTTTVQGGKATSPPFGSAGAGVNAALSVNPWKAFVMELRFGGQALSLNGIYLGPAGETVWEQPLLGTFAGLSFGWGGEKVERLPRDREIPPDDSILLEGLTLSEQ